MAVELHDPVDMADSSLYTGKKDASPEVSAVPDFSVDDPEAGDIGEIERVYRKLDRRIIPALWVLYFLCSAVRSNVGLAQTMNIDTGHDLSTVLHLSPHQISTGLALFYVGYVVFEIPSNLMMTKLSPRVWMSRIVVSVGLIGACMAAMDAAWSLYLLRLLLGIVEAGLWPGMTLFLALFYPPSLMGKRIGQYFTAAQVSAAVVGLVSAGFQHMDGERGLVGFKWMFLVYGVVTVAVGISLLWWLPERPIAVDAGEEDDQQTGQSTWGWSWLRWLPKSPPVLTGRAAMIHYHDLKRVYHRPSWGPRDLLHVFLDWRLYPLLVMYFGVVGVGIGVQNYVTMILQAIDPGLSGVQLSLLSAPIWMMDLIAILLITPLSDRFHHHRPIFFIFPTALQMLGLFLTTYTGTEANPWSRYGGLLIVGFGLGPTVPITMTWTTEIFQPRHGEVGVAAASAVVSGLGNLGSIVTTYALYQGWPADYNAPGRKKYEKSNMVLVGILGGSILAAVLMGVLVRVVDGKKSPDNNIDDGAARRNASQRGLNGIVRSWMSWS